MAGIPNVRRCAPKISWWAIGAPCSMLAKSVSPSFLGAEARRRFGLAGLVQAQGRRRVGVGAEIGAAVGEFVALLVEIDLDFRRLPL